MKKPSLQMLHEQSLVLWKPLGDTELMGEEKGLAVKIEDKFGSFLVAVIKESLGKIVEEIGQLLITE